MAAVILFSFPDFYAKTDLKLTSKVACEDLKFFNVDSDALTKA